MKKTLLFSALFASISSPFAMAENVEVALKNNLDGFLSGYCIDVLGMGKNARIEDGLQTHTCYSYRGSVGIDQAFDSEKFANNQLYLPELNVCAELAELAVGSKVNLAECNGNELQQIQFGSDGTLRPVKADNLCISAGLTTKRGRNGTSDHQIKTLTLQECADNKQQFQQWYGRTEG